MNPLPIFIISDSSGETAITTLQTAVSQFPDLSVQVTRFPFTATKNKLTNILQQANEVHAVIFHTLVQRALSTELINFCQKHQLVQYDGLNPAIDAIKQRIHQEPLQTPGVNHSLNDTYFDRIAAIEFAVTYDDGKLPAGFKQADLVLVGVSRTSKTPLSLFLANQNFKVANLPLVPNTKIPDELWQVDPKKIVGLTNSPKILEQIRAQRMIAYGMDPASNYSNQEKIHQELDFANQIFTKLNCLVINVANKSIEETATLIISKLGLEPAPFD